MTSQRSLPGLIESASRFDSSSARVRLTSSVGSSCIVVPRIASVVSVFTACEELRFNRRDRRDRRERHWLFSAISARSAVKRRVFHRLKMLLPAVRTVLPVFGLAADELFEELIPLVAQLLMDADVRRVITADG